MALTALAVLTLAIVATTMPATTDQLGGRFVGRHLVNAPGEASGVDAGLVAASYLGFEGGVPQHHFTRTPVDTLGGTANNTPSELSGGAKRGPLGKVTGAGPAQDLSSPAEWPRTADATAAAERYDRHQRR
jgi:hypothetical protein